MRVASSTSTRCASFNVTLVSCCCVSHLLKIDRNLERNTHDRLPCTRTTAAFFFFFFLICCIKQSKIFKTSLSGVIALRCQTKVNRSARSCLFILWQLNKTPHRLLPFLCGPFFLLPLSHLRLFSNAYMISQFCASLRDKEWLSLFLPEAPVERTVAHGSRR